MQKKHKQITRINKQKIKIPSKSLETLETHTTIEKNLRKSFKNSKRICLETKTTQTKTKKEQGFKPKPTQPHSTPSASKPIQTKTLRRLGAEAAHGIHRGFSEVPPAAASSAAALRMFGSGIGVPVWFRFFLFGGFWWVLCGLESGVLVAFKRFFSGC